MDKQFEDETMVKLNKIIIERLYGKSSTNLNLRKLLREVYERGKIDGQPEYVEAHGYIRDC